MKVFIALAVLLLASCVAPIPTEGPLDPLDFGADPSGQADSTDAFREMFAQAEPGDVIDLREGMYALDVDDASTFTDATYAVSATGLEDVSIRNGKVNVRNPLAGFLSCERCDQVSIKDVTVDYETPPYLTGTVVSATEAEIVLDLDARSGAMISDFDWESAPIMWARIFDDGVKLGTDRVLSIDSYEASYDRFVFTLAPYDSSRWTQFSAGDTVLVNARGHTVKAFGFRFGSDLHVKNVTVHHSPGIAFGASFVEGSTFDRVRVVPSEGARASVNGDGIHVNGVREGPIIRDSEFVATFDDMINVKDQYGTIDSVSGATITIRGAPRLTLEAGDSVLFYNPLSDTIKGNATVISRDTATITLDRELDIASGAYVNGGDALINLETRARGTQITNSRFVSGGRYGVFAKASDATISDNEFVRMGAEGVMVGPTVTKATIEGFVSENLMISNNSFVGTFRSERLPPEQDHGSAITAEVDSFDRQPSLVLTHSICVSDNTFVVEGEPIALMQTESC